MRLIFLKRMRLPIAALLLTGTLAFLFQNCAGRTFTGADNSNSENSVDCEGDSCDISPPPETCSFNGLTLQSGDSVKAFLNSSGTCTSEDRLCMNGELSGSYQYASCSPVSPRACLFNGITIAHGSSTVAYLNSSGNCAQQTRVCNDGQLSGDYQYRTCVPTGPADCMFNGQQIKSGKTVIAYKNSAVPFGSRCESQVRSCDNGALSGGFSYGSCVEGPAASCLFNGQTVPHGGTVVAYQTSNVPVGQTCSSQVRTCNNGSLSGSYGFGSCSTNPLANCLFNGQTVVSGSSIKGYFSSLVPYGNVCNYENRLCTNGSLSGSAAYISCTVGPKPQRTENFTASTEAIINKVDLLFVVDESVSMQTIISQVQKGFAAIAKSSYPSDTKMAVTNMAPAKFTNVPNRTFNATKSFVDEAFIPAQPGFLQLVNKSNINSFKNAHPGKAGNFTEPGCANGWFSPGDLNSNNKPCLTAHTQVALQSIGVEAGVISLEQLTKTRLANGDRLFRSGALANVIFVSDTHDPGEDYYNKAGAADAMLNYAQLRELIYSANSGILGLKFNGIVPLPKAGHNALTGLKVIGALPSAGLGNEGVHGYSYLKYVKATGGVAMHAGNSNWTSTIAEIVKETGVARNPIVVLAQAAASITSITVNGSPLAASEYTLSADRRTIEITKRLEWNGNVSIQVVYAY